MYLRFVRSIREGDFELYVQVLTKIAGWCHALDQVHYARWLPVHIKDLVELAVKHPLVHKEFMAGKFVVKRSSRRFSLIGKDHSHEQSVKFMKSDSGIQNLFDKKDAMDIHIMALPEKISAIAHFEEYNAVLAALEFNPIEQHEESLSIQKRFSRNVKAVYLDIHG